MEDATPSDGEVVSTLGVAASGAAPDPRLAALGTVRLQQPCEAPAAGLASISLNSTRPPSAPSQVLVAGATGGVGKEVVRQLTSSGAQVRALVRDAARGAAVLPGEAELAVGDVTRFQTLPRALRGCSAVVCATGATERLNPLGPATVDWQGVANLVAAAQQAGVTKFVLVTSIGADDLLFPLNAFFGVLAFKKLGETALQRSGLDYTIVRPGGLQDAPRQGQAEGSVVMAGADAYGLPPRQQPGSVLRRQVAEVCVAALVEPDASGKVVEVVAERSAPARPLAELFASVEP